jgi:hypothetical protein
MLFSPPRLLVQFGMDGIGELFDSFAGELQEKAIGYCPGV